MSFSNVLRLSFCLASGLLVAACGQGGGGSGDPRAANRSSSTETATRSYQLVEQSCDTGKVEIKASSEAEAAKGLCDALLSDERNRGCARSLRQKYFEITCPGQAWLPLSIVRSMDNTQPPSDRSRDQLREWQADQQARRFELNLVVQKFEISDRISKPFASEAKQLADSLMSCGLSELGPKCLEDVTFTSDSAKQLVTIGGLVYFVTELKLRSVSVPLLFKFPVSNTNTGSFKAPELAVGNIEISRSLTARGAQSLATFVSNPANFETMIVVTPEVETEKSAWLRLQKPRDVREVYHMAKLILNASVQRGNLQKFNSKLASAILDAREIIASSDRGDYQTVILELLLSELGAPKKQAVAVANSILISKSSGPHSLAAALVLDDQPSRLDLRPVVMKALESQSWRLREIAVVALMKTPSSTAVETSIMARIDDPVDDVQRTAIAASDKMKLGEQHFSTIQLLSESNSWRTRKQSAILLGRLATEPAVNQVISQLDDSVGEVQTAAREILEAKTLNASAVQGLARILASNNWSARRDASNLLGKISDNSATISLISGLDDHVSEVQSAITTQLMKRKLTTLHVAPLVKKVSSDNWRVRQNTARLLGKIDGLEATNALIEALDDHVDEVQAEIVTQLKTRTLTLASVRPLKTKLGSDKWPVRRSAARMLGQIQAKESREALQVQLAAEHVDEVKQQILASLRALR